MGEQPAPCAASSDESLKKQAWLPNDDADNNAPIIRGVLTPSAIEIGKTIGIARTYKPQLDDVAKVKKAMTAKITAGKIIMVI